MDRYDLTYPELITAAAADRIKRMELAEAAHRARRARRAARARRVRRSLAGWTRLRGRGAAQPGPASPGRRAAEPAAD